MSDLSLDIGLGLSEIHVLVTGGAGLIGRVVVSHFLAAGCKVSSLDIAYPSTTNPETSTPQQNHAQKNFLPIHCDISSESSVSSAFSTATSAYGPVEICIALASLDLSVLTPSPFSTASFTQLQRVLNVNIAGTWLTARAWFQSLAYAKSNNIALKHPNLIIIGSESGHFGERTNAEYALGKSAVQGGLLASLRAEAPRAWKGARVNCVAPGPVETERWAVECAENESQAWVESRATTALGEPVPVKAVAMAILSLASHNFSSHIHGQVLNVDSGKQGKVMWMKDEVP